MPSARKRSKKIALTLLFLIAVVAGYFYITYYYNNDSVNRGGAGKRENIAYGNAFVISKHFVSQHLNMPNAEFPANDYTCQATNDNVYVIKSFVIVPKDKRSHYTAKMKYLGGNQMEVSNWKLLDIIITP